MHVVNVLLDGIGVSMASGHAFHTRYVADVPVCGVGSTHSIKGLPHLQLAVTSTVLISA